MFRPLVLAFAVLLVSSVPACSSEDPSSSETPAAEPATVKLDPSADFRAENGFFDHPYPSDLRLDAKGAPDVDPFHDPGVAILTGLKKGAQDRKGFPVVPVGYFRLTAQPTARKPDALVEGGKNAPLVLVDVDPSSPERGTVFPVVAETPNPDRYAPEWLVSITARPGIILAPNRKYAFFITKNVGLEGGGELTRAEKLDTDEKVKTSLAPLWETLDKIGVDKTSVAGATVFTTGDVVAETAAIGDKVLAAHKPDITDLALEADPTNLRPSMCHLIGKISMPQFQKGVPPFDTEGLFEIGPDGAPVKQRDETLKVSIAFPRTQAMPAEGFPLVVYIHGSGGVSRQFVDGGGNDENDGKSTWPGVVLTERGFGVAGTALPISPERVSGVSDYAYINPDNLVAIRDTFREGVLETRLLISALERLVIPPAAYATCGATATGDIKFAPNIHIQGQSMGGMYTNLIAPTDPRIKVAVPTGGGGYWIYFLLQTSFVENVGGLLSVVLKTSEKMSFLHPALHIGETAIEAGDPIVSANRVAKRPLPGHPARFLYAPQGKDDSYFPIPVYDAMTLSYGNPRAGNEVWPSMHEAQKLVGLDTVAEYPVKLNLKSENDAQYTGAVTQWEDLTFDSHQIYRRNPSVQHQYGCFHQSFRKTGVAVLPAPQATRDAPCAE